MSPKDRLAILRTEIWVKTSRELGIEEKRRMLGELHKITEEMQSAEA